MARLEFSAPGARRQTMSQKLLQAVAKSTRLHVVNMLKKSQGLTVGEIAAELGMSYMGARDVCTDLRRRGVVEEMREPRPPGATGRPRLRIRLTERAHTLFPSAGNSLTLELLAATRKLHGPSAPEKLLMLVWREKAEALAGAVRGSLRERAEALARLRDAEGHMAAVEDADGLRIVERHCPFLEVLREYPLVERLEAGLFEALLGVPVQRVESVAGGLVRVDFIAGPAA